MRLALVASPDAGQGIFDCASCLGGHDVEVETLDRAQLAEANLSRFDRLVVAGGDGSIGRAAVAAGRAGLPLAVIPTGTANNFVRATGVPAEPSAACALAAGSHRTRPIELGWAGDVPFVNLASAGLAPVAGRRAARWKRLLGAASYTYGAASAAVTTPPLPCEVRMSGPEEGREEAVYAGEVWQVMVAVSGAFGSGIRVEPTAPADGNLDLFLIEAGPRAKLAAHAWRMRNGTLRPQPGVVHERAPVFEIELAPGAELNVDGEVVALGPTRFSVERDGVQLVVP